MAEEPVGHERPTDEELLRTYGLAKRDYSYEGPIDDWPKRAERAAVVAGLRAVLARYGAAAADGEAVELPPRPPLMQPPAHLALERYGVTWDGSSDKPLLTRMADGYWTPWHVAADLLKRQMLRPIPVSEKPPGPGDCLPWPGEPDETPWCWAFVKGPLGDDAWERRPVSCLTTYKPMHTHWLAAHDLPLPEFD